MLAYPLETRNAHGVTNACCLAPLEWLLLLRFLVT